MTGSSNRAYRAGIAVAVLASFLTVWTTIVRDDDGGGFFLLIMAAAVGAFAVRFEPAGMARTMVGVAVMQLAVRPGRRDGARGREHAGRLFESLAVQRVLCGAVAGVGWHFSVWPQTQSPRRFETRLRTFRFQEST